MTATDKHALSEHLKSLAKMAKAGRERANASQSLAGEFRRKSVDDEVRRDSLDYSEEELAPSRGRHIRACPDADGVDYYERISRTGHP